MTYSAPSTSIPTFAPPFTIRQQPLRPPPSFRRASTPVPSPPPLTPPLLSRSQLPESKRPIIRFQASENKSLPIGRYKIMQGFLCVAANESRTGVSMSAPGLDNLGWTWDPSLGTLMVGSDEDKSSLGPNMDATGPRWYLGAADSSCSSVTLVPFTGPPPDPNAGTNNTFTGWKFDGTSLTLTTCAGGTCLDSTSFNEEGKVPVLNTACDATKNTMQWAFDNFITAQVSGTGKLFASLIIAAVGVGLVLLNRYAHRISAERRQQGETRTERLIDTLAKL